jgi:hypothetical protein
MIFPQLFAARANIAVALWIEGEVGSREREPSVRSDLSISFTCGSIPRSSTSYVRARHVSGSAAVKRSHHGGV